MIQVPIKWIQCKYCERYMTPPKEINPIFDEYDKDPLVITDVKENDTYIILSCPKCNKEVHRVRK